METYESKSETDIETLAAEMDAALKAVFAITKNDTPAEKLGEVDAVLEKARAAVAAFEAAVSEKEQ